jgi:hypothetical protein
MSQIVRVRECEACGEVCSVMDTACSRCKRYGTLNDRLQCTQCRRLVQEKTCWFCAGTSGIREGDASLPAASSVAENKPMPAIADPNAVPPRLAGAVGGAVFGVGAGIAAAYFVNESALICGAIGAVAGTVIGALFGGSSARRG